MTDKPATLHTLGFTAEQAKWLQALEARISALEGLAGGSPARVSSWDAYPSLERFRADDGSIQISLPDVQDMDAQQLRDVLTACRDKPEPNTSVRVLRLRVRGMLERMFEDATGAKEVKRNKR